MATQTTEKTKLNINVGVKIKKPSMYTVVMFNDDITTMDFVIEVLVRIFHKSEKEAEEIMLNIHNNGMGIAGVFTYDIAISKKMTVDQLSQENGFPLKLTVDEAR